MPSYPFPLLDWPEASSKLSRKPALLLGNGASRAVWDSFEYDSLFEVAQNLSNASMRLTPDDVSLFEKLGAKTDFEAVLYNLALTLNVMRTTGCDRHDISRLEQIDSRIRQSLIHAVDKVHVPRADMTDSALETMGNDMENYCFVFSLNYDLLLYWAINHVEKNHHISTDGFHNDEYGRLAFDTEFIDYSFNRPVTKIYYLHGGLHLYTALDRAVCKHRSEDGAGLLANFAVSPIGSSTVPLFVSEGDGVLKEREISRSGYLSVAYEELRAYEGPIVILGCALGKPDGHLVKAMTEPRGRRREVAVSVYPGADNDVVADNMRQYFSELGGLGSLSFFDSRTHPLASSSLKVG
jgi:Domain of unknown function (DUF4917)